MEFEAGVDLPTRRDSFWFSSIIFSLFQLQIFIASGKKAKTRLGQNLHSSSNIVHFFDTLKFFYEISGFL